MGMFIGDVWIPYVSNFNVDNGDRKVEIVRHIDHTVPPHFAEFPNPITSAEISGTVIRTSNSPKSANDYADDIESLTGKESAFNYIHNYQNNSGWLSTTRVSVPNDADMPLSRDYSISGYFLSNKKYKPRLTTSASVMTNDYSITLGIDGADNYIPLPIGASYSTSLTTISRSALDGTMTLVKSNDNSAVEFDINSVESDVGECKIFDTMTAGETDESLWKRVYNVNHVFEGDSVMENGLVRMKFYDVPNGPTLYYYNAIDDAWVQISDRTDIYPVESYNPTILEYSTDKVSVKTYSEFGELGEDNEPYSSTLTIERGKPFINIEYTSNDELYSAIQARFRYIPDNTTPFVDNEMDDVNYPSPTYVSQTFDNDNYCINIEGSDTTGIKLFVPVKNMTITTQVDKDNIGIYSDDYNTNASNVFFGGITFDNADIYTECEDMTTANGASLYSGGDASGGSAVKFDAQDEMCYNDFVLGTDLPIGTYKLVVRAKFDSAVDNDLTMNIRNKTEASIFATENKTLSLGWEYYIFDVTLTEAVEGDALSLELLKNTTTPNNIYVDYVVWLPISSPNKNFPKDLAHQALVESNSSRELIGRL
jgi:hypothetical protein